MIPFILFILIPHDSASWVLVYLGTTDAWKDGATAEVQSLIAAHANTASSEPIHRRLSAIPISAWEDEMPVAESIIRETLRIVGNATLFRRNLSDDFRVCGKTVDKGAFMTYNLGDVHLNERFYSNPLKFDPGRFNVAGEDRNAPFLAWGMGRHPCTGQLHYTFSLNSSHREIRDEICQIDDQNDPRTRSLPL
jgi:cytochrome P450